MSSDSIELGDIFERPTHLINRWKVVKITKGTTWLGTLYTLEAVNGQLGNDKHARCNVFEYDLSNGGSTFKPIKKPRRITK